MNKKLDSHKKRTRNKRDSNGKKFKSSVFADDIILYVKDQKVLRNHKQFYQGSRIQN
jgi:hypothetical protein